MIFLAFPEAASSDKTNILRLAFGADRPIREDARFQKFKAAVGIGEVRDSLLKGLGFVCRDPNVAKLES
jgi:hypothetical protein